MAMNEKHLRWVMDKWTNDELTRAVQRYRERIGLAPKVMYYNPADQDKVNKLQTDLARVEYSKMAKGCLGFV
jgi:hypothetical protein